jgi:hypothetical protein
LWAFVMYIMAHEPISTAYFIKPSHQSVFARQRLGNTYPQQQKHNRRIVGQVSVYAPYHY